MKKLLLPFLIASTLSLAVFVSGCRTGGNVTGKSKEGIKLTLDQIADIQPGLGAVMMELGNRMWVLAYAGDAGNWGLSGYELKEMKEAIEVAKTTRPKRKEVLTGFEKSFLDPIEAAIKAKDASRFKTAFNEAVNGCNDCHKSSVNDQGETVNFIKWEKPATPPPFMGVRP